MFLGDAVVGLVAVTISLWPALYKIVCKRVEATTVFDQSRDVYLGTDKVAYGASVVVERGCEEEVYEGCSISPIVENRLARLLSGFYCCTKPSDC